MCTIAKHHPAVSTHLRIILAVSSGVLLALSFPNFDLALTGWFCFVPLLISLENTGYRFAYSLGLITGIAGMSVGFYWISEWALNALKVPFAWNWLFVLIYAFCFGQVFGLIAIIYKWLCDATRISPVFLFPLVWVSLFSVFPMIFHFHLGDGQWRFLTAIQPVEYTGVYGLDFLMAMTSALVFCIISSNGVKTGRIAVINALLLVVVWFVVGYHLLQNWQQDLGGWSVRMVGIVQPNRQVTLSRPMPEKGFSRSRPLEMMLTEKLVDQGAELVVWPEGHFYGFSFWESVRESFREQVASLQVPLVFHDTTHRIIDGKKHYFNSILYLDRNGNPVSVYDKIKLVPFSEYLPFFESTPPFDWILGDYLDNLTPGKEIKTFEADGLTIIPKICYEPLYPEFVAESVGSDGRGKLIVVQSQDGWFGESSQPFQHMAATTIRAVENRVPLLHVIQNGPSAVIQPSGDISFMSEAFTRGAWVVPVSYHDREGGSFFSGHPHLFLNSIRGLLLLALIYGWSRRKKAHPKQ